jgi:aryl-alcohol dehydrogenase-like predicted oxidoreductase
VVSESTTLGRTNSTVSRIGFGADPAGLANYLDPFSPVDTDQREGVIAAIGRTVEVGINYFDTAAAYGSGESEKIFGKGLTSAGIASHRDDIYVATKVSHDEPNPSGSTLSILCRFTARPTHPKLVNKRCAKAVLSKF